MDWLELILTIGSLVCTGILWFKNRSLAMSMEQFKTELSNKKVLYVICPKCGNKVYLTLENVQEETQTGGTEV